MDECCRKSLAMLPEFMDGWMGTSMGFIFEEELPANLEILERRQMTSFSSKTMTPISFKG
jgi:hypothetical protein